MRWRDGYVLLGAVLLLALAQPLPGRAQTHNQTHKIIRLATQNYPPYQMLEDGEMTGIAFDRVRCVLDDMETSYEIVMLDWSKAQLMTEQNKTAGFFVGAENVERAEYATPSDPVVTEELVWYIAADRDIDPNKAADKLSARYSATFASNAWLLLKRGGYNVINKPQSVDALVNMLVTGDIDVALGAKTAFSYARKTQDKRAAGFRMIHYRDNPLMVHFSNAFLSTRPQFLTRFNNSLATCTAGAQ